MKFSGILILVVLFTIPSCKNDENSIIYEPIGYFSTEYSINTGAPRQGILDPKSKGIIILDSTYNEALRNLDQFEYIYVLFHFHESEGWDAIVTPPESDHEYGLFATRSPRRPNPIGLSLIKVDSVNKNQIFVSGIDVFNGTPVLDIKPFLPSVDYVVSEKNMISELYLGHHDEDFINDSLVKIFVKGEK